MKVEIKHKITGLVIFSSEHDNNSIKNTIEFAVKNKKSVSFANLSGADLSGADLRRADLSDADLRRVIGNMIEIKTLFLSHYVIVFTKDVLAIGCKQFTHEEWRKFDDETIAKMDSKALEFWKKWKDFIFQAIKLSFE